jgi:hypothetical protein
MRRREFITVLGGAAAAWPLAARAQQSDRMRRIGVLSGLAESDTESQTWIRELTQRLQELGWTNGRNCIIDSRYRLERCHRAAAANSVYTDCVCAGS